MNKEFWAGSLAQAEPVVCLPALTFHLPGISLDSISLPCPYLDADIRLSLANGIGREENLCHFQGPKQLRCDRAFPVSFWMPVGPQKLREGEWVPKPSRRLLNKTHSSKIMMAVALVLLYIYNFRVTCLSPSLCYQLCKLIVGREMIKHINLTSSLGRSLPTEWEHNSQPKVLPGVPAVFNHFH